MQTIFPILRYQDARRAIESLCAAFDFVEVFSVPPAGDFVRHAQLRLGTNIVMLGSVRPEDSITAPQTAGVATQALCVYVEDIEEHYERARSSKLRLRVNSRPRISVRMNIMLETGRAIPTTYRPETGG